MASIDEIKDDSGRVVVLFRVRWRDSAGEHTKHFRPAKLGGVKKARALAEEHRVAVAAAEARGEAWKPRAAGPDLDLEAGMIAFVADIARTHRAKSVDKHTISLELFKRFAVATSRDLDWSILSQDTLAAFHAWLSLAENGLHGEQRATGTVNRIVGNLQIFWKWCAEQDTWAALAGMPKRLRMKRVVPKKKTAPTFEEMARCVFAANGWHHKLAMMLYGTGLRVNQVMLSTWADVDFERGTYTLRPELGKTDAESRGRTIPLAPWLLKELETWGVRTGWIVPSNRTRGGERERVARDRDMARAWARAGVREAAWKGQPHHRFRAGFISGLKALGADDEAVEVYVGDRKSVV